MYRDLLLIRGFHALRRMYSTIPYLTKFRRQPARYLRYSTAAVHMQQRSKRLRYQQPETQNTNHVRTKGPCIYLGEDPVISSGVKLILHGPVPRPAVVSPACRMPDTNGRGIRILFFTYCCTYHMYDTYVNIFFIIFSASSDQLILVVDRKPTRTHSHSGRTAVR